MPAHTQTTPAPAKRRGWLWRLGKWTLWGLLALVVLHRPLLHFAGRRVAIWLAAREHMTLDFSISGNVWSALEIRGLSLRADGTGPAPVERLTLDRVALEYDLWKAVHSDWPRVLRRVDVGTLDGVLAVQNNRKDTEPATPIATVFSKLLSNSLSPVEHLSVKRVDLEVKGVAAIRGLAAEVNNRDPGQLAWEKIHVIGFPDLGPARAELVANESTFAISKLPLLPQIVVRRLSLNHVTATLPRGGLEVLVETGGGTADLRVEPSLTPGALDATVDVSGVRLNELAAQFGTGLPSPVTIENFRAKFTGAPENLESSTADVGFILRIAGDEKAGVPAGTARGTAQWGRGVFRISELSLAALGAEASATGELNVPLQDLSPSKLSGELTWKLSAPDLSVLRLRDVPAIGGTMSGSGKLRVQNGEAHTTGEVELAKLSQGEVRVDAITFHLDARRKINALEDLVSGLTADGSFDVKGVTAAGVRLDKITVKSRLNGQHATVSEFSVTSGENRVTGTARATLMANAAGFAGSPEMDVVVAAPKIEQFGVEVNGAALSGNVAADGKIRLAGLRPVGELHATGADLQLGKAPLGGFSAEVKLDEGGAVLESLKVTVADAGTITATGRASLDAAMTYSGELHANFPTLAKLDAILATAGHPAKLGGTLSLDWSGSGRLADMAHNGRLRVAGKNLRHDSLTVNEVRVSATYSPTQFDTDELFAVADKLKLGGHAHWQDGRLALTDLSAAVAGVQVIQGEASMPLNLTNPGAPMPPDQPVSLSLMCKNADIAPLLANAGITAPVSGKISGDLVLGGTLAKPEMKFSIAGRALKSPKAPSLAPADLDATASLLNSRFAIDATVKQRDIQPITLTASLPVDFEKLRADPASMRDLPVQAVLKMPASSLAMVPRFVPAVAKLDGTVAANVELRGTVGRPVVNGEVTVVTKSVRLAASGLPPVSNFTTKLIFQGDTITLRDTRGEIAGGTFSADGSVNIAKPAQPALDLRLRSDKVLVMRDESITVRADTDLTLRGPLNSATAAGTVFVTQSRFFKDVDILPLALPGKPKPQARTVAAPPRISFPNPPLRDWKFDIAIRTREKDSFLIRGNLAKGSAAIDLRLGGTGLAPFLTGHVQVENFSAVLPAGKLEVRRGYVTFAEDEPFMPHLDVQAESRIGKNTVLATISGPALAPRLELESEPPLPQKDILSLLATGTTSGEIGSNASAIATKAALLTVKRWYRKAFKKGAGEPAADGQESFADRFDLDIGNVDPKTGRPDVNASVRITDNVFFLGEIDMQGQFTGRVKYLLRFR